MKKIDKNDWTRLSVLVNPPAFSDKLDRIDETLNRIEALLMHGLDPFKAANYVHTRESLATLLKVLLSLARWWFRLAAGVFEASELVAEELRRVERGISAPARHTYYRHRGDSDRSYTELGNLGCNMPSEQDYLRSLQLTRRWTGILDRAKKLWRAAEPYRKPPSYATVRDILPLGGKLAYSMLYVADCGVLHRDKPSHHPLFGWTNFKNEHQRLLAAFQWAIQQLSGRVKERKGPKPAWSDGVKFVFDSPLIDPVSHGHIRVRQETIWKSGRLFSRQRLEEGLLMGNRSSGHGQPVIGATMMLRLGLDLQNSRRRLRMVSRVQAITRDVPTIITGEIVRVSDTFKVYKAPAFWREYSTYRTGHLWFRKGWSDCVHVDAEDGRSEQQILESVLLISNRARNEKRSSRKAVADVCRKLRRLERVCVEDSFRAGNCVPGTQTFLNAVGLSDTPEIAGPALARRWRKAGYPDHARLELVADQLLISSSRIHLV